MKLKNKDTNNRFRTLESDRKGNFEATLSFGSNEFRMYLMKNGKSLLERTVTVTYEVQHAGPDNPNMGDAPKIVTNLDDAITSQGGCHDEKNNAFEFKVTVTAADGIISRTTLSPSSSPIPKRARRRKFGSIPVKIHITTLFPLPHRTLGMKSSIR